MPRPRGVFVGSLARFAVAGAMLGAIDIERVHPRGRPRARPGAQTSANADAVVQAVGDLEGSGGAPSVACS